MTLTYVNESRSGSPRNTTAQLEIERTGGDDAYADYNVRLVDYAAKPHRRILETQIKGYPRANGALNLMVRSLIALGFPAQSHRELSLGDARELSKECP